MRDSRAGRTALASPHDGTRPGIPGSPRVVPALSDLGQEIAGPLPLDLIKAWLESDRTPEAHEGLLRPFAVRGTVVCSDSTGLSRLTRERPLLEVLRLVNIPKRRIASFGLAIGGEAIGVWIADDTQMFYPDPIPIERVIEAMVSAQIANRDHPVQVGMAIHHGDFYRIGGGMYGEEADRVEHLAENGTRGGEIILVEPRTRVRFRGRRATVTPLDGIEYPAPFAGVCVEESAPSGLDAPRLREGAWILARVFHASEDLLLDQLSRRVSVNARFSKSVESTAVERIKSNGVLGIFHAAEDRGAREFALALFTLLRESDLVVNIAVARGEVMVSPRKDGEAEVAGGPVNIASKLAEDTRERNRILVHESCSSLGREPGIRFRRNQAGVVLRGWTLKV